MSGTIEKSSWNPYLVLALLALPTLLVSMDMTILYLATPALSADLRPTSAQPLWMSDIYSFVLAGTLISRGVLGDRIGQRKILLIARRPSAWSRRRPMRPARKC